MTITSRARVGLPLPTPPPSLSILCNRYLDPKCCCFCFSFLLHEWTENKTFCCCFSCSGLLSKCIQFLFLREKKSQKTKLFCPNVSKAGHTQGCQYPKTNFYFESENYKYLWKLKFNRLTKMFSVALNEFSKNICQIKTEKMFLPFHVEFFKLFAFEIIHWSK